MSGRELVVVAELTARIGPLLHGHGPEVQGAVLADLVATWLAGFQGPDKDSARQLVLETWLTTMRQLLGVNDAIVKERAGFDG